MGDREKNRTSERKKEWRNNKVEEINQDGDSGGRVSIRADHILGTVVVCPSRLRALRRIYFNLTRPTCARNFVPPSGRQTGSERARAQRQQRPQRRDSVSHPGERWASLSHDTQSLAEIWSGRRRKPKRRTLSTTVCSFVWRSSRDIKFQFDMTGDGDTCISHMFRAIYFYFLTIGNNNNNYKKYQNDSNNTK